MGAASVLVYVDPDRKNRLTLKWRAGGKPKKETLARSAEPVNGKLTPDDEAFAIGAAMKKALELSGQVSVAVVTPTGKALTIGQAEALIINPETGKYAHRTQFRDELVRSLRFACAVWGATATWLSIEEQDWTKLLRLRLDQLLKKNKSGWRATEITVSALVTTVRWLRRKKLIPIDAAPWPDDWKHEIKQHWKGLKDTSDDPEPFRPRYTPAEAIAILKQSAFDPRFNLLMWSGMELRLGQVVRTRRSDLKLPAVDWSAPIDAANDLTHYGTMEVRGAGKKHGTVVDLARGQRAMIEYSLSDDGYLGELERRHQRGGLPDYRLFPAGFIVGRVGNSRGKTNRLTLSDKIDPQAEVGSSWVRKSFREAEERAGVPHIKGRGAYGIRRGSVDVGSASLSPAGLKNLGGWVDIKMPEQIYKENENKSGAREARGVRAKLRGDIVPHFNAPDDVDPRLDPKDIAFSDTINVLELARRRQTLGDGSQ